ncbi:ammonium transporter [Weissella uvarum]
MVLLPLGFASVIWYLFGFTLSFSGNGLFFGNFHQFLFNHVSFIHSTRGLHIPDAVFAMFQGMFPLITMGIIAGSVIDRINFKAFNVFIILWLIVVYFPLAHMTWGGGLLQQLGVLDFAGGDVVHIASGFTGLVLALVIGSREQPTLATVHHAPSVTIGAILLWLGWFGFNAGSALALNESALIALFNTILAGALGFTIWQALEYWQKQTPTLSGSFTGALSGLVLITPGAGFMTPQSAFLTILIGTPILYGLIKFTKQHFQYDDALDAFGVHGLGGVLGGLATGLFASPHLSGHLGAISGNWSLLLTQLAGISFTILLTSSLSYVLIRLIGHWMPLTSQPQNSSRDQYEHHQDSFSVE